MSTDKEIIQPKLTGKEAEDFVEFFSKKTFLKPWVFRSPKCDDGDEFSDVAVVFKDTIILIEVKGNKFDPNNPQRYLKEAKERHRQLLRSRGIIERKSKKVNFTNEFFSFSTDFSETKKIYLISISTGPGEMEISSGKTDIDYSKLNHEDVGKYLGFFDNNTNIHSFTADEMVFASKHIDTLKDFFWYLDFEKKFLGNEFETKKEGQSIIALVDENREDMISIYLLNYYWDDELNKTGNINLNKIFGSAEIEKADMIMYAGADTRNYLEDDKHYKKIQEEKKISYFWDNLINHVLSEYTYAYKITGDSNERKNIKIDEIKSVLEEMSYTSRLERVEFSEKIKETDEKGLNFRNIFSMADGAETLFSYSRMDYEKFPTPEEQDKKSHQHLYSVWCRIKFGENLKPFKDKIKKALLITRHAHGNQSALSFALSTEILVDENFCRTVGVI